MSGKFDPVVYNCKQVTCSLCLGKAVITTKGEINVVGGKQATFKATCGFCNCELEGRFVDGLPAVRTIKEK